MAQKSEYQSRRDPLESLLEVREGGEALRGLRGTPTILRGAWVVRVRVRVRVRIRGGLGAGRG